MSTPEGLDGYKAVTDATVTKAILDMIKTPGSLEGFISHVRGRNPSMTRENILHLYSRGNEEARDALIRALDSLETAALEPEKQDSMPKMQKKESTRPVLTRENLHVFDAEHEYPGHTEEEKIEIRALIQSACGFAGFQKKPYVQINFLNGSRVYAYTVRKGVYIPKVVSDPDVVDDFKR